MKPRTIGNCAGWVAGALLATSVAAPPALAQTTEELAGRVHELEQELQLLRRQLEAQIERNRDAAEAASSAAADDGPTVKMKGPAPTFSSADGDFTLAVTGRVHWDMGIYDESGTDSDLNDGSNLRRARLGVKGRIMKDWGYEIVLDGGDSAADDVDIDTAFVSWNGLKPLTVTLGQHKAPLTLEDRTSSNDIPFIERSLSTNLFVGQTGGKRMGLSAIAHGDMWWVGAGVFGEKLGVDDSNRADEHLSYSGRVAFAPIREKAHGIHVGANAWIMPEPGEVYDDDDEKTVPTRCRFRDRPEFRVDDSRWIDARSAEDGVERCHGVGAEFAAWFKPMWFAGEYTRFGFDGHGAAGGRTTGDATYDAMYAQAGWVLTGEGRPYSMSKAAWSGVKPANPLGKGPAGTGAFELVGRYSHADLDDAVFPGGVQTNYTIGLNWWVNNWVAFKFNYISVNVEDGAGEDEFDIYGLRAQVTW